MKTNLTLEIEEALKARAIRESKRYGFEVRVPGGICDHVTTKIDYDNHNIPHVICYEIKVSFSDYYHSDNGANFVGDENYYVMPAELLDEILSKQAQKNFHRAGIITYKDGKLRKKTDGHSFRNRPGLTLEQKLVLMDTMLMRALYAND